MAVSLPGGLRWAEDRWRRLRAALDYGLPGLCQSHVQISARHKTCRPWRLARRGEIDADYDALVLPPTRARRSDAWFHDPDMYGFVRRAFAKSMGLDDYDLARPIIGIAQTQSDLNNCNNNF